MRPEEYQMSRHALFVFGARACVPEDPLRAARAMGCTTTVVADHLPCSLSGELIDRFERVDPRNADEVIRTARWIHRGRAIDGVVAYDDQSVATVARVAAELGLPGNPVEAALAASDKFLMKQRFDRSGVPIAPFHLASDEEDAAAWAEGNGYPVVVKPVCGSASQGVIRAESEAELRHAYRWLRRIVARNGLSTGGRPESAQLVEAYLPGSEISVELLVQEGRIRVLCVFDKPEPLIGPFFEETIYHAPSRLPTATQERFRDLACRAVRALGIENGPAHCEIRYNGDDARILEVGGRLIGGSCARVFRYLLEDDIHSLVLQLAFGEPLSGIRTRPGCAGAMMLPIPGEGRLARIEGLEDARRLPAIQDVMPNVSCGDIVVPFPEQSCYIGFLTAAAEEPEAVDEALREAARRIDFKLEPIECENWVRSLADRSGTELPPGIEVLEGLTLEEASERVLPVIARTSFPELPSPEGLAEAKRCLDLWVEDGECCTSPELWLLAGDRGVVLGGWQGRTGQGTCLGVAPEARRSGTGSALLEGLMTLVRRRGCTEHMMCVDPREHLAIAFYRTHGFQRVKATGQACCEG